jgi:catechol 2,3-dioxygenase-like lactoylglutathione lyase family enzyme
LKEYAGGSTSNDGGKTMKQRLHLTATLIGLTCAAALVFATGARTASPEKHAFTPEAIPYGPPPPFVAPGAQLAVIEGNPGADSGDFTVRLKMPDGYRIAPHWHPHRENVTVISGTFKVGMGDSFDESKMGAFPAGSFAFLDPDMHHYAMASGEVVVQVHGASPLQFNYINPNDDPSRKK